MALGSSRREVMGLVLRQGALLVGLGLAIGIVAAAGMAQLLRSLLLGLHPWDPLAFAGVLAALLVASFARVPRAGSARDPGGPAASRCATNENVDERNGGLVMATLSMSDELGFAPPQTLEPESPIDLKSRLLAYERDLITAALAESRGNQRRAAHRLGILPTTLHEKMKRLGLRAEPFLPAPQRRARRGDREGFAAPDVQAS